MLLLLAPSLTCINVPLSPSAIYKLSLLELSEVNLAVEAVSNSAKLVGLAAGPTTSKTALGDEVPIPTFPELSILALSLPLTVTLKFELPAFRCKLEPE